MLGPPPVSGELSPRRMNFGGVWRLRGERREPVVEYSETFKTRMVQKMWPPNGRSAGALAGETGLPQPTLSRWLREARKVGDI